MMGVPGQGPVSTEYTLQAIIARRTEGGVPSYCCKWESYCEHTWESLEHYSTKHGNKGTRLDKSAADQYFDNVLLGTQSTPSSDYVCGVDYAEFPSSMLTPMEEQLGAGVCDDIFLGVCAPSEGAAC